MSLADVEERAVKIVGLLRNGGRPAEAHELARLAVNLSQRGKIDAALEEIVARSNGAWQSDYSLTNISRAEWLGEISALQRTARAELQSIRETAAASQEKISTKAGNRARAAAVKKNDAALWRAQGSDAPTQASNIKTPKTATRRVQRSSQPTRTASAGPRRQGLTGNSRRPGGPIIRAETPFLTKLVFVLPPLALLAYCVVAIIDAAPDPSARETILVEGVFDRSEALSNYSPFGIAGVIHLRGHEVRYGVRETLGYGFEMISDRLREGDRVSMLVESDPILSGNKRLSEVVGAVESADTVGSYGVAIERLGDIDLNDPVPFVELSVRDETIYSRLQLLPEAEGRIWKWGFLAIASLVFMVIMRRLSAG